MTKDFLQILQGDILEEDVVISLSQLCRLSNLSAESVIEMIEYGVIEPYKTTPGKMQFRGESVSRLRCASRLTRDLGVNTAGAALALDLLQELKVMRARLERLETQLR
jgi:chaperone modulatory protein CbpM